ncbi:MAG: hypothetical protein IJZ23_07610 [Roseburia sp.]|nr:hypothetical protein [Roseburia sp.]
MVKNFVRATTVTATSVVDETVVIRMRATINEDGTIGYGKNVLDTERYLANLEQCDADYAEFESKVRELV